MRYSKTVEAKYTAAAKKAGMVFAGTPDEIQVQVNRWYATTVALRNMKNRFGL